MTRLGPRALRGLIVFGAVVLLIAASIVFPRSRAAPPEPFDPFSAVPRTAVAIVRADVRAIASSRLDVDWTRIEPSLPAGKSLANLCRFDPLGTLDRIVVFVPKTRGSAGESDFGLAATGSLSAAPVIDCAEHVISARGRSPVRSEVGSFHSVRARDASGIEVAVRDGGPLLIASGPVLRDMVDAAEGRSASVRGSELERDLAALAPHPIAAAVELEPGWLAGVVPPDVASRSPLGDVRSASLTVDLGSPVRVAAAIRCTTAGAATAMADTLAAYGRSLSGALRTRYGISRDDARTRASGTSASAELELTSDSARRLLDALLGGELGFDANASDAGAEAP